MRGMEYFSFYLLSLIGSFYIMFFAFIFVLLLLLLLLLLILLLLLFFIIIIIIIITIICFVFNSFCKFIMFYIPLFSFLFHRLKISNHILCI